MNTTPEFLLPFLPAGATSGFPGPGDYIKPDGWAIGANLFPSDWAGAMFFIHLNSNGPIRYVAVDIEITGKKVRVINGSNMVRVKITYVKEDEPNVTDGGWMLIDPDRKRPGAVFSTNYESFYR